MKWLHRAFRSWPLAVVAGLAVLGVAQPAWPQWFCVLLGPAAALAAVVYRFRPASRMPANPLIRLGAALLLRPDAARLGLGLGLVPGLGWGLFAAPQEGWRVAAAMAGVALVSGLLAWLQPRRHRGWLSLILFLSLAAGMGLTFEAGPDDPWLASLFLGLLAGWSALMLLAKSPADDGGAELSLACVLLGAALAVALPAPVRPAALLAPGLLFLLVNRWLLRPLQALQLTLEALGHEGRGQAREALECLHAAARLQPDAPWVLAGAWRVQRHLEPSDLRTDPRLLELIDPDRCMQRAEAILLRRPPPGPVLLEEARRLLSLVVERAPQRRPEAVYWQTVADLHGGDMELAAERLRELLDERTATPDQRDSRRAVLTRGWELALWLHPRMVEKVGLPLLAAGRRFDALAAAEEALKQRPGDPLAIQIKQRLYPEVTRAEYEREAGTDPKVAASGFDHRFCADLARSFLGDASRWRRGVELMELAARGLPGEAPLLLDQARQAALRHGDAALAAALLDQTKRAGLVHGAEVLTEPARQVWWATLKALAEAALSRGDRAAALENLRLYAESPLGGADTQRLIADLSVQEGDITGALIANARCLVYDANRPDHLALRDRCYFSLTPELLRADWSRLASAFDAGYCVQKARALLDTPGSGPPQAEWAGKLARLVLAIDPEHVAAKVQLARSFLALKDPASVAGGYALLGEAFRIGQSKPLDEATREDWYLACRLLGDHHLEQGRPAEAIACLSAYRKCSRSGANTLFKLGQAHEQLGQVDQARVCYDHVAYYNHPLAAQAKAALARLKGR